MFPERLPVDYFRRVDDPVLPELENNATVGNCTPVEGSDSFSSPEKNSLDIKSKVHTETRKPRIALSRRGRLTIHRAGACFDMGEDSERLLLTGTLPGSLPEAFEAIAQYSTYATGTLCNWLTRRHPGCKWLYAWEYQKRGALHLHLVAELPLQAAAYVKEHFKDEWNRILTAITAKSGVNLRRKTKNYVHTGDVTQADVTICTKEPSRYISKYVSKQGTTGFGRWRYPPRQWYQVSRSLLRSLRERTQIHEKEGLSYRQARTFIEDSLHNLSSCVKAGSRFFTGSVLSWSAYGYRENLTIEEFGVGFMRSGTSVMPVEVLAKIAVSTLEGYPQARCWNRLLTATEMRTIMAMPMRSETELLLVIQTVTESLTTAWGLLNDKQKAARFLYQQHQWFKNKYGYQSYTPEFVEELKTFIKTY